MQNAKISLLKASTRAKCNLSVFVNRAKQALLRAPPQAHFVQMLFARSIRNQNSWELFFWPATGKFGLTEGIFKSLKDLSQCVSWKSRVPPSSRWPRRGGPGAPPLCISLPLASTP